MPGVRPPGTRGHASTSRPTPGVPGRSLYCGAGRHEMQAHGPGAFRAPISRASAARDVQGERSMPQRVLTTTVVGSYPQPDWLVDRQMLSKGVPRVRLSGMWRVPELFLEQA